MWRPAAAGVACFRQKPSEASARGFVQESLCLMVVSPSPDQVHRIYTLLHGQLTRPARLYFERHVDVLKSLRDAAVTCLADPDVASSSPSVMQGAHFQTTLKRLLASMPDLVLTVVKALDAGARVVVYSEAPLHHLTSTVVAVSSVIESETAVMPYVPLVELNGVLRSVKHAIVGTNNRLAVQSGNGVPAAEVVWDVDKGRVRVEEGAWSEMLDLSSADRRFAALLAAEDDAFAVFQRLRRYRSTVRTLIDARTRRRSDSQTDGERDDVVSLDRALGDFNAKWAGKMYSYLPRVHIERTDDGEDEDGDVSARMHPCYDELDHLWSSVTEQTQAIGAQAQRGISMASSALSNLMGSLANTLCTSSCYDDDLRPCTDHACSVRGRQAGRSVHRRRRRVAQTCAPVNHTSAVPTSIITIRLMFLHYYLLYGETVASLIPIRGSWGASSTRTASSSSSNSALYRSGCAFMQSAYAFMSGLHTSMSFFSISHSRKHLYAGANVDPHGPSNSDRKHGGHFSSAASSSMLFPSQSRSNESADDGQEPTEPLDRSTNRYTPC